MQRGLFGIVAGEVRRDVEDIRGATWPDRSVAARDDRPTAEVPAVEQ